MAVAYPRSRREHPAQKPRFGSRLDYNKAPSLVRAWLFNEGAGTVVTELLTGAQGSTVGGVWTPISGPAGICHDDQADKTTLCPGDFLPTDRITVVLGYKKRDGTARASASFGIDSTAIFNEDQTLRCGAHLPYSDGVVYWDFGGFDSSHRLSAAGLTFGDDVWAFSAGPRGLEIWQNGLLRASNTGATGARNPTSLNFALGTNGDSTVFTAGSDLADYRFLYVYSEQIPADAIAQISAAPYRIIRSDPVNRFAVSAGGATAYSLTLAATQAEAASVGRQTNHFALATNGTLGDLVRSVSATRSAAQGQAANISASKAFLRALSASAAGTASLVRAAAKTAAGTQGQSASMVRLSGRNLTAPQSQSGAVARSVSRVIAASQASAASAAMMKVLLLGLTAAQAGAAMIQRSVSHNLSASSAAAASLARRANKAVSANQEQAADLSAQKSLLQITISAAQTSAASVGRSAARAMSASASCAARIGRAASRTVLSTAAAVGSIRRRFGRSVSASSVVSAAIDLAAVPFAGILPLIRIIASAGARLFKRGGGGGPKKRGGSGGGPSSRGGGRA